MLRIGELGAARNTFSDYLISQLLKTYRESRFILYEKIEFEVPSIFFSEFLNDLGIYNFE